jgi:hypothetical protein
MELIDGQHLVWRIEHKRGKKVLMNLPKGPPRRSTSS